MDFIKVHCLSLAALPPGRYWWRVGMEMLLVTILLTELIGFFISATQTAFEPEPHILAYMVLVAPVFETLLSITLPAGIIRLFRGGQTLRFLAILLTFALLHYGNSLSTLLSTGLVGGFYYAFTYIHWQPRSEALAFWIPVAMHTLFNGTLVGLYLLTLTIHQLT